MAIIKTGVRTGCRNDGFSLRALISALHVFSCVQHFAFAKAPEAKQTNQSPTISGHLFIVFHFLFAAPPSIILRLFYLYLAVAIHMGDQNTERYRLQHKLRLSYMPWLYASLKPKQRSWAQVWQDEWQDYLVSMETISIGNDCFIAPEARLFAEPGRPIVIGDNSYIAADCVLHGPITLGNNVSINHHVSLDGGRKGIHIGDNTRIAAYSYAYAFNHGMDESQLIRDQAVSSQGIRIGSDVWIGANTGIVDGVTIGDHAVVGMGSIVTKTIADYTKVAGNPARVIGTRSTI